MIENHPTSAYVIDAWEDIEYTQWAYMDEPLQAAETALAYVARYPESAEAADFLFLAGRSYERAGDLDLASITWQRIGNEYPSADYAFLANYFAGIVTVRQGNWASAQPLFSRALVLTSEPSESQQPISGLVNARMLWVMSARRSTPGNWRRPPIPMATTASGRKIC